MIEALTYIQRQLHQRQEVVEYEQVHNLQIVGDALHYRIYAPNELIYMLNLNALPQGTKIISEINAVITEGSTVPADRIEEFSGLIDLYLPSANVVPGDVINLLYYQVILKRQ